jgi:hypothetical protein
VIAGSEWPNLAATTCSETPASSASVAEVVQPDAGQPGRRDRAIEPGGGDRTQRARVSHVTHNR